MSTHKLLDLATQAMLIAVIVSVVLLLIAFGTLVFLHVCVVGRALRRQLGSGAEAPSDDHRISGLSTNDLEKLPRYEFKAGEERAGSAAWDGQLQVDCAVCLESFQVGDTCRLLPACRHSFHAQCIDSWLLKSRLCPICRTSAGHGSEGGGAGDRPEYEERLT